MAILGQGRDRELLRAGPELVEAGLAERADQLAGMPPAGGSRRVPRCTSPWPVASTRGP